MPASPFITLADRAVGEGPAFPHGVFGRIVKVLFEQHGQRRHPLSMRSSLDHALACAHGAEQLGADEELVAAALLHDTGYLLMPPAASGAIAGLDRHAELAVAFCTPWLGPEVVQPIALQDQARRYLAACEDDYMAGLGVASRQVLMGKGGPMNDCECADFEATPGAARALRLCRVDDAACQGRQATQPVGHHLGPHLDHYLDLVRHLAHRQAWLRQASGTSASR